MVKLLVRYILGLMLCAFLVAQFVRPEKQTYDGSIPAGDLRTVYAMPRDLMSKMEVSCYDCHSDQTRYPWYSEIQPFGWWLASHIREGKEELNFSRFGTLSNRERVIKIEEIIDEVWGGDMPLRSYTWTHRDAIFSDEETDALIAWGEALIEQIEE